MSEKSDSPIYFWPYDLFGYLLPGVVLIAPLTQFQREVRDAVTSRYQGDSISDHIIIVIVCYISGHIVASLSSSLLEKGLLNLTFGYPVVQFFGEYNKGPFPRRILGWLTDLYEKWPIKHCKNFLGGVLYTFAEAVCKTVRRRLDVLPGFAHPYDADFAKSVEERYRTLYGTTHEDWSLNRRTHDLFWIAQSYVTETMPRSHRTAIHFVELYGFSRNASMAFAIVAFYPYLLDGWKLAIGNGPVVPNHWWTFICLMASFFLYSNFTKLQRRQNDLILRAFVASRAIPNHQEATSAGVAGAR